MFTLIAFSAPTIAAPDPDLEFVMNALRGPEGCYEVIVATPAVPASSPVDARFVNHMWVFPTAPPSGFCVFGDGCSRDGAPTTAAPWGYMNATWVEGGKLDPGARIVPHVVTVDVAMSDEHRIVRVGIGTSDKPWARWTMRLDATLATQSTNQVVAYDWLRDLTTLRESAHVELDSTGFPTLILVTTSWRRKAAVPGFAWRSSTVEYRLATPRACAS